MKFQLKLKFDVKYEVNDRIFFVNMRIWNDKLIQ
jgi:hypothetical protein